MVRVDAGPRRHQEPLPDERARGQHRGIRPAVEGRGVDEEQRRVRGRVGVGIVGLPGRDELLVLARIASPVACRAGGVGVVADPPRLVVRRGPTGPYGIPDLLLLPDDERGCEIVDHERQLVGLLTPVRRTEHRPDLATREEQLLDAEGVLPEPQDPVAGSDARVLHCAGAAVDAGRGLGPGQRDVGVARRPASRAGPGRDCAGRRRATAGWSTPPRI